MKVLKFGGTSVGSAERMQHVAEVISSVDGPKIVVLSAMSGTTNKLVSLCGYLSLSNKIAAQELILDLEKQYEAVIVALLTDKQQLVKAGKVLQERFGLLKEIALGEYSLHSEKTILAQGELLSTELFYLFLEEKSEKACLLPALDFMRTNEDAEPNAIEIKERLIALLAKNTDCQIVVTQGYICRNAFGEVDNLKRGGSDYSASLIGAACNAEEIQIWTDIDGMHNNDPRVVDKTRPISQLSYDEAAELAYFGAKILHPSSILPARFANIPVKLKNTLDPKAEGTLITTGSEKGQIKATAAKDGITAITIKSGRMLMAYGFLRAIFEVFERYKTPIDLITTSEVAVSVTIDDTGSLDAIVEDLRNYGMVEVEGDMSIICLVGNSIGSEKGIAYKVMHALKEIPIRMISYGGSMHNVSLLVPSSCKVQTLKNINSELFNL